MAKISNEVKVGVVALLTIVAFIFLYNFLKGKDLFSNSTLYYSVYDEIGGLAESSPVEINGYKVGVVQSIHFIDETSGRLLVTFSVSKGFKLPVNTVAEIVPVSIIAGMKAQFVYGDGPGFYKYGDTIPGKLNASITTTIEEELGPIKKRISNLLDVIDSVIVSVDDIMDAGFRGDLKGTVANLNSTTESINRVIGTREKELKTTLDNITRFSQMLSDNSSRMAGTFTSLESVADTLAAADIFNLVMNLKTSLEKTSLLFGNLNEGKGSAGQILTNDSLYEDLTDTLKNLNALLEDMKANPKRYVHFSLFGKKNIPSE
ncbi:MAG: MlaD protein [Bacteroidota bacterium]|nr:MlaD protein [Bacteroidota bacterium]